MKIHMPVVLEHHGEQACHCSIHLGAGDIKKWYYSGAGFNKLGLMQDDTVCENDGVTEAITRLPRNLDSNRMTHIMGALHLTAKQQILHKEQ